jgi:pteridine reductase
VSEQRIAVVTGAGIRVGRAIALALAKDGCDVVVHANKSRDQADETKRAIEALGRKAFVEIADLADDDALDAFAARVVSAHGRVDVLVHSAAGFEKVPFAQITRAQYRAMQRLNIEVPFFLTQRLLPALEKSSDACVVHIVDDAWDRPMKGYAHYSVSKGALAVLTRALANELGPKVRVCGVLPGAVLFPTSYSQADRDAVLKRVPLAREGSPEDVAGAVVFLSRASYVSGALVPVDGARSVVF